MGSAIAQPDGWLVCDSQMSASERLSVCRASRSPPRLRRTQSEAVLLAVKPQSPPSTRPSASTTSSDQHRAGVSSPPHAGLQSERVVRLLPTSPQERRRASPPSLPDRSAVRPLSLKRLRSPHISAPSSPWRSTSSMVSSASAHRRSPSCWTSSMHSPWEGSPRASPMRRPSRSWPPRWAAPPRAASSACHPIALVSSVCSAGDDHRGMEALADGAFEATVMAAVRASAEKNRTLEATALEHNNREDKQ